MSDDSDDDAPPVASSLSSSRAAHLAREAAAPRSKKAIREGERAATKKRQSVVTKGLRGDDYLPDEILSQLPSGPTIGQARRAADTAGADEQPSKKKQMKTRGKCLISNQFKVKGLWVIWTETGFLIKMTLILWD